MPATLTKSGRSPVAGSHKLHDHWEYKNILVLHIPGDGDSVLRVCLRWEPQGHPGDATYVDLDARDADQLFLAMLQIVKYEVAESVPMPWSMPEHCSIYQQRSLKCLHTILGVWTHEGPVYARATHEIPKTRLVDLVEWLAPRLEWEIYEC